LQTKISVIAVAIDTKPTSKGSYQVAEVTYKDVDKNKVASKKIMSFAKPESIFKTMALAKQGEVYDVELIKNEGTGYWDWTNVTKGSVGDNASVSTTASKAPPAASTATKGGWETPAERAAKQIYIVRQSSISAAVNALSVGAKVHPKAAEVINYARELEQYVFETDRAQAVASKDVERIPEFGDLEDPLPF
jgi:hypothetical protein